MSWGCLHRGCSAARDTIRCTVSGLHTSKLQLAVCTIIGNFPIPVHPVLPYRMRMRLSGSCSAPLTSQTFKN